MRYKEIKKENDGKKVRKGNHETRRKEINLMPKCDKVGDRRKELKK